MTAEIENEDRVLAFAHIGDLHLTNAKQRNVTDFLPIVAQIEIEGSSAFDFVVLPGDNADNGKRAQYILAATALKMLSMPVHVLPGDHDMEGGSLAAFHEVLAPDPLPKVVTVRGTRCLFLDMSGRGDGGPDFRLGTEQATWIERELDVAREARQTIVVFMHSYPDDLRGEGETEALNQLLAAHDVALVDSGHTHYNELANDGRTIFAATRSTGQIEEGPVGYSIATLDGGIVSWRFNPLDDAFPFVVITAPADHRLLRNAKHVVSEESDVRALVNRTSSNCKRRLPDRGRRSGADDATPRRAGLVCPIAVAGRPAGHDHRPGHRRQRASRPTSYPRRHAGLFGAGPPPQRQRRRFGRRLARERHSRHTTRPQPQRAAEFLNAARLRPPHHNGP